MPLPTTRRAAETAIQGEAPQSMLRSEKVRLDPEPCNLHESSEGVNPGPSVRGRRDY